jgi:hypothetical protein
MGENVCFPRSGKLLRKMTLSLEKIVVIKIKGESKRCED